MRRIQIIILMFSLALAAAAFVSGCARTVTERIERGERVSAYVNFAGSLNITDNKYYMIVSNAPNYQLPMPPDYEFIEPGIPPSDPQIDYYQFYSTWSGYIVIENGMIYLVDGPIVSSRESYSRIEIGGPISGGSKISFEFRLDQFFGDSPPDVLYFDFVSTDPSKKLKDHLSPPSKSIQRYNGMIISGSDEGTSEIDPSLDILDWSVSIE